MTRMTLRGPMLALLAALVALVVSIGPPGAGDVRAATPDLTLVSDARYEVQPEEQRVRVTVDITARNRLRDTTTRRFYFDRAFLAVMPGTTAFRLTSPTGSPTVRVSEERDQYQVLELVFGQRIYSQQSRRLQLQFDLPDRGGAPARDVRVGSAFVSFPVWAFASEDTPGSRIRVVFPKGYTVQVETGELPKPRVTGDGRTVFQTRKLAYPLRFFAYLVADRPAEFRETTVSAPLGDTEAEVTVRAWPDDPDWQDRVTRLFERGLPVLHRRIGLPWRRTEPVVIEEAVSRTTGGYAGVFDPDAGRMEVAYHADASVVLHEAAHVWFNGALLRDRWANEAFASYYAEAAGTELDEEIRVVELTDELRESAFPLNEWGEAGGADGTAEDYGYGASLAVGRAIAERAGDEGLRRVWAAAEANRAAYQPPAVDAGVNRQPEQGNGAPDWRGLLDLLEDITGRPYDDLWREWVVRDAEVGLLAERRVARDEYAATVTAAGRWELPPSVRAALRAWDFEEATALLAEARGVLDRRAELEAAAASTGLRLPPRLETAFEGEGGFAAAAAEADAEAAAIEIVRRAAAARPAQPDVVQQLGLWGETPEANLENARNAFAAGDLEGAAREAMDAQATWQGAGEVGRNRILIALGITILVILALVVLASQWRSRRGRGSDTDADDGPGGGTAPHADAPDAAVPADAPGAAGDTATRVEGPGATGPAAG